MICFSSSQNVHNVATTWRSFTFPMTAPLQKFCILPVSLLSLLYIDAYENAVIGVCVNTLFFLPENFRPPRQRSASNTRA